MMVNSSHAALVPIFERILKDLEPFLPFSAAGVFLEDAGYLQLVVVSRAVPVPVGAVIAVGEAQGYLGLKETRRSLLQSDEHKAPICCIFDEKNLSGWMAIPFIVHEAVVGVIVFASNYVKFRESDVHLAQTFINQAAIVVEKAQLAESLAVEKRNLELLYELSQNLIETLDLEQVAERAVLLTTRVLGVEFGEIMLIDPANPKRLILCADVNYGMLERDDTTDYPFLILGQGTAGWAALHRTPVIAPDVNMEPTWLHVPEVCREIRSTAAIPLIAHDQLIGVMELSSAVEGFFQPDVLPTLQAVAAPIAMALQNARLYAEEQNRYAITEALRLSTSTLTLDLDRASLLQQLLERLQQVVPFDSTTCFLFQDDAAWAVAMMGVPDSNSVLNRPFPVDGIINRLMVERKPIFIEDVSQTSWFGGWGGTGFVRGWMAVPLIHRGRFIGYISLDNREPGAYGPQEAEVAQAFANQAAVTIVNAQLLQESRRAAEEQWTLSQIVRQLNATSSVSEIMPATAWGLRALVQCDAVELALFDFEEMEAAVTRHTYHTDAIPVASRHSYLLAKSAGVQWNMAGEVFQVENGAGSELRAVESIDVGQGYPTQVAVPLQVRGRVLGSLRMLWRSPTDMDHLNMTTLAQIADAVAMTTEKNILFNQTQRRIEEMETIAQLTTILRPLESPMAILNISLSFVQQTFECDVIRLYTIDGEHLTLLAEVGQPSMGLRTIPRDGSIFGHVVTTGRPYLSGNYPHDPLAHPQVLEDWVMQGAQPLSAIFAPVYAGSTVTGVIAGHCLTDRRAYTQDDLHLLGAIAGIIGTALQRSTVLDTLEHRVAERTHQLEEANERLQELDRLKSEFIANISHELRTPLTNIRFYTDLLRRGRVDKHAEYLHTLENETQQLKALIDSVLDLSRLSAARLQGIFFDVSHFDLAQLLHDTCGLYEKQAEAQNIALLFSDVESPILVDADRSQINQAIATLLSNAIAYTDPGGRIEVAAHLSHNSGVEISIRDTGIGIDDHEMPHLFERFFRGSQALERGIPGAGLGLNIVKEILDLHGGTIHIQSKVGEGTHIQMWLPQHRRSTLSTSATVPLFNQS